MARGAGIPAVVAPRPTPAAVAHEVHRHAPTGEVARVLATRPSLLLLDEVMGLGREVRALKKSPPSKSRLIEIKTKSDLVRFLEDNGQLMLAETVEKTVESVYGGGVGGFSIVTSMSERDDQKLIAELVHAFYIITGIKWSRSR